jgi:hypothetical protein
MASFRVIVVFLFSLGWPHRRPMKREYPDVGF